MTESNQIVMVIEDEALLLQVIAAKLKLNGFTTIACASAGEALANLNQMEKLPEIIWLDYHLKDMDGLSFMVKLKEREQWQKIPVIIVSNSATDDKVQQMLALGAKKYMLKAEHRLEDIIGSLKTVLKEVGEN